MVRGAIGKIFYFQLVLDDVLAVCSNVYYCVLCDASPLQCISIVRRVQMNIHVFLTSQVSGIVNEHAGAADANFRV